MGGYRLAQRGLNCACWHQNGCVSVAWGKTPRMRHTLLPASTFLPITLNPAAPTRTATPRRNHRPPYPDAPGRCRGERCPTKLLPLPMRERSPRCRDCSIRARPADERRTRWGFGMSGGVDWSFRFLWKGSVMTPVCCPSCRLRFTPGAAAYLVTCPECGRPPERIASFEQVVGFRRVGPQDMPPSVPQAVAVSLPVPDPGGARS